MDPGLIGGIIGGTFGLLGGVIGTYASITNTNGPLERALMIKASIITWVGITIFLVLLLTLPKPYNYLMWIVYGIFLPLGIITINRKQAAIRDHESGA